MVVLVEAKAEVVAVVVVAGAQPAAPDRPPVAETQIIVPPEAQVAKQ
jgi:hypothetical protein